MRPKLVRCLLNLKGVRQPGDASEANTQLQMRSARIQSEAMIVSRSEIPYNSFDPVLAAFQTTQTIQRISPTLRAPYVMQSAVSVERQLPHNTTLAITNLNLPSTVRPSGVGRGPDP